jgi:hypothetical protein
MGIFRKDEKYCLACIAFTKRQRQGRSGTQGLCDTILAMLEEGQRCSASLSFGHWMLGLMKCFCFNNSLRSLKLKIVTITLPAQLDNGGVCYSLGSFRALLEQLRDLVSLLSPRKGPSRIQCSQ